MEEISKYILFDNDEYLRIIFIVALKPPGDVSALRIYICSEKSELSLFIVAWTD